MPTKLQNHIPVTESGCWLWLGSTDKNGYGTIGRAEGSHLKAHRESYREHVSEIPDGLHVLHKCDTPSCINPAHLYVGTPKENAADKAARGRMRHTQAQKDAISLRNIKNPRPHDPTTGRFI